MRFSLLTLVVLTIISKCFAIRWCYINATCSDNPKKEGNYWVGYVNEDGRNYRKCAQRVPEFCYRAECTVGICHCDVTGTLYTDCVDKNGKRTANVYAHIDSFDHY